MKRIGEVLINILFWVSTIWALGQIFTFQIMEIDSVIINGVEKITEKPTSGMEWLVHYGTPLRLALFYLIALGLIPLHFSKRKYLRLSVLTLVSFLTAFCAELLLLNLLGNDINWALSSSLLGIYTFYLSVSLAYGISRSVTHTERQRQLLKNEKLDAELKLLRSQINPHFLFNSLNNLLAIAEREQSQEISRGITQLSDLLRFLIYDTQTQVIKLEKEVEFIKAYIALHRLRYTTQDDVKIDFKAYGELSNYSITPSLLIPFIENAFKHGIHLSSKSFIDIRLEVSGDQLNFTVLNSKHTTQKTEFDQTYSGVGLENVKKRLELLGPEGYTLDIKDASDTFNVNLKLNLGD